MRILIIAHYFPPLETVGAYRPASWARYWSAAGHDVTVLTTPKGRVDGTLDPALAGDLGYRVCEVPYGVPFARANPDLPSGAAQAPGGAGGESLRLFKLAVRQLRRNLIGPLFDSRDFWIAPALREASRRHDDAPFDVAVSTYGPPATHIVASRLKQHAGLSWVADYRDLWADHVYPGRWPFCWYSRVLEERTVATADLFTTTSDDWSARLEARFKAPVVTIENGYDHEVTAGAREVPVRTDGKVQILYTGTLYRGDRDPTPLFLAIRRLLDERPALARHLEVLFVGDLEGLSSLVRRHRLEPVVTIMPPQPLGVSLKMQRHADLLLFVDWARDTRGWLTAKLFEYMHSGTPILAIGGSRELTASRLIEEMGAGVALGDDVDAIVDILRGVLDGASIPYAPDADTLSAYTRKALAMRMLGAIEEIVRV